MYEYPDLAQREELSVDMLLTLLEVCLDGRSTLIAIFEHRADDLSKKDVLRLVRMAPTGCGTGLVMATNLLSKK